MNKATQNFTDVQGELNKVFKIDRGLRATFSGMDWSKKDMYEALGRPDLRPQLFVHVEEEQHDS